MPRATVRSAVPVLAIDIQLHKETQERIVASGGVIAHASQLHAEDHALSHHGREVLVCRCRRTGLTPKACRVSLRIQV